ncbi:MAG: polysaccharide biosynthesis tyrosine autokinase [Prevotella sp.]|jgi:capsular exopolysaccharide synthesis family protein|nr:MULTISPECIES: tyrosine-protein kinase [unclassified Prevotella]MCH3970432.1 polysaccharide biosynthesis tyrosine autokinase [Prevotella sp.]MCH3991055.1 polysaccharide biosynthesis tyrosine autokinase [Prevotella sp.]MCH4186541.1 polysaccharide biosynthesis tyrosine autokinase [Prevotella sp.]MCH4216067.1 polysaccharide biosynthesis tyrosine autokinase [Prevotella sp.]MCH4250992.1 polysaccharide biosynthesis tyrosine autokinase [Prevotella sp.]
MEEYKNTESANTADEQQEENEKESSFDFATLYATVVLNWKWFVLSLIVCLGLAFIYIRYSTPVWQADAKLLIKDDDSNSSSGGRNNDLLQSSSTLGLISGSNGIDNEMEILSSHLLAEGAINDLKLYVNYSAKGHIKDYLLYKDEPISVDIDPTHLDKLNYPIKLIIEQSAKGYHVTGKYAVIDKIHSKIIPYIIDSTFPSLPIGIVTHVGVLTFRKTDTPMNGMTEKVTIYSLKMMSKKYVENLTVSQTSKNTSIAQLVLHDEIPDRATDYLTDLIQVYNRQANEDKNEVAVRTENFINNRLEKINAELGNTEGQLENYKKRNNMVEMKLNSAQTVQDADTYSQKLSDANTQIALLSSLRDYMRRPTNRYQTLPSNVGLTDQSATELINKYNEIVLQRNKLMRSASESSPSVIPLTAQLNDLTNSIRHAVNQAIEGLNIQRNSVAELYGKYQNQVGETPAQERMLNQIGRQQDVKSGLYLTLLQKREENSINLAATVDKGKLIDIPDVEGIVSPKKPLVFLLALILGLGIPALILFILQFFHYKIEGHEDVAKLTKLPIIADVAVANDKTKAKADIVVSENQNNQMEEIFRSMRTNLQFLMKKDQQVILFTSSTSGEGKTFNAANLAVSFALLGKKVILLGLDIRKPRLAELFQIRDHHHGITPLLVNDNPSKEEIEGQILPSGVNKNLDLLMAGPTPPNPAELLTRSSLDKIIAILRKDYDYIIIDSAPVGLVTDTLQVGRVCDATVIVCRADYTPKESFGLINSLSDQKKLPNMSIVINGIDLSKKKYGYYYGYGKYGKYGKYGHYGNYGHYGSYGKYGHYGNYGSYGSYGSYANSHYGKKDDDSVKK